VVIFGNKSWTPDRWLAENWTVRSHLGSRQRPLAIEDFAFIPKGPAMQFDQFADLVAQRSNLDRDRARALADATLKTLSERITGGEARDLAAQLPTEFKASLESAQEPAEAFSVDEFVRRVAERTGLDENAARDGARVAMVTIREAVTGGEWDDITSQLPTEYSELTGPIIK